MMLCRLLENQYTLYSLFEDMWYAAASQKKWWLVAVVARNELKSVHITFEAL